MKRCLISLSTAITLAGGCVEVEPEETLVERVGNDGDVAECIGPQPFEPPSIPYLAFIQLLGTVQAFQVALMNGDVTVLQALYTGPWTNWSDEPLDMALVKLAVMRGVLAQSAAHNTYLDGALIGNVEPGSVECSAASAFARTADGTCNDPEDPMMGAANTRFGRNMPLPYSYPDPSTLLEPNPREISLEVLRRKNQQEMHFLNMIGAAWTQFQIHDWFSHGENDPTGVISVPLATDDPLRVQWGLTSLDIRRTMPDPTRLPEEAATPPSYLNTVTHWWDGSQIYGSDEETVARLRSGVGGKLKISADGLLPEAGGQSDTGVTDNWWLGLELLHTLFALEHNAIADMLAEHYPSWDDQRLYDTARLINGALIARIHTLEWTPAILPNPTLQVAMHTNWAGLQQFLEPEPNPLPPGVPPLAFFPATDPVIHGIVGNARDLGGIPYFLTEEFVSVYRMHPMLPEKLELRNAETGQPIGNVHTEDTRDESARELASETGLANVAYSFGTQNSGALVLQNYPKFLQDLFTPVGFIDMGTIDIVRDRERGIPRYNNARRLLSLKPLATFEDLTGGDEQLAKKLSKAYGGDIEKVDFMVGMFAEGVRPDCYGFSETAFQIFTLMATRRLQNDRFFTDDYRPEIYTSEGLDWVETNTMASVLLRHYPELAEAGLTEEINAFIPWQ